MIEMLTDYSVQVAVPKYVEESDRFELVIPVPGLAYDDCRVFVNKNTIRITTVENDFAKQVDFKFVAVECKLQETKKQVIHGILYVTIFKKEEDLDFEVE